MQNFWKPRSSCEGKNNVEEKIDSLYLSDSVMECLKPEQMQGLADMHKKGDLDVHSEHNKVAPLSDEARIVMEERMKPEYHLYQFVQDRLDRQYEQEFNLIFKGR